MYGWQAGGTHPTEMMPCELFTSASEELLTRPYLVLFEMSKPDTLIFLSSGSI